MKTTKMSLANIQGKLSRAEMKNIMAGSGTTCSGNCDYVWFDYNGKKHITTGSCLTTSNGLCYCSSGGGTCSGA